MSDLRRRATALVKECEAQGYRVKRTRAGWRVLSKDGQGSVVVHQTPSEYRGVRNAASELRKIGVDL